MATLTLPDMPVHAGTALGGFWRDTFGREVLRDADVSNGMPLSWDLTYPVARTARTAALDTIYGWLGSEDWLVFTDEASGGRLLEVAVPEVLAAIFGCDLIDPAENPRTIGRHTP